MADNIPYLEWLALEDFYKSTNGKQWSYPESKLKASHWNFTSYLENNPCSDNWAGVACECPPIYPIKTQCHVRAIDLVNYKLIGTITSKLKNLQYMKSLILGQNYLFGTIPSELFCLKELQNFVLSENNLKGTIPSSVGDLDQLQILDLEYNSLAGSIPISIGNLIQLKFLILSNNALTGSMPLSFWNLTKLKYILLNSNTLSGSIPNSIGNLIQLERLYIYSNFLTGSIPSSIANCLQLKYLLLQTNLLTGSIPSSISNLSQMEYLYLNSNALRGSIPKSIGNLNKIQALYLYSNFLTGNIPVSIYDLAQLVDLEIAINYLSGTISSSIGKLTNIQTLILETNALEGCIPITIGNLKQLQVLYLFSNKLIGNIPSSIGQLINLQQLQLYYNFLTGSIPMSIGYLNRLYDLDFGFNSLTGSIPVSIGNLSQIQEILIQSNKLEGTIPSTIGNLIHLRELDLYANSLNGSMPSIIGNLKKLKLLYLQSNSFTGSIPSSIGNLIRLQDFFIDNNYITGSIPIDIGNLNELQHISFVSNLITGHIPLHLYNIKSLQYINFEYNSLVGNISEAIGNLIELQFLDFRYNFLHSTIPSSIGKLIKLQGILTVQHNHLTGTIPPSVGNLKQLQNLYLDKNFLSGTIPLSIGDLDQLQNLFLRSNSLTGTIPSSFRNMKSLVDIFLNSNNLHGSISNLFNSSTHRNLQTIQLNNNQFTGTIPKEIFSITNLLTFSVVSNCFTGDIPYYTICESKSLINLIIDGIHTASSCRQLVFPSSLLFSSSYIAQKNQMSNKLDPCVFSMKSLSTLHISGNGLTGCIPTNIIINNSLTDLSLSHNLLTGSIPKSFQSRQWKKLDLSFNRITGTLSSDFMYQAPNNCSLYLQENRLSGNIPESIVNIQNISVLSGNIFQCDLSRRSLPQYDSDISKYNCASNAFNIPYYIWMGLVGSIVIILILRYKASINCQPGEILKMTYLYFKQPLRDFKNIHSILNENFDKETSPDFEIMKRQLYLFMKICLYSMLYIVTVLLIVFAVNGSLYGTYTYSYGWRISAGFQSGSVSFCCSFVFFNILTWLLIFLLFKLKLFQLKSQNKSKINEINNSIVSISDIPNDKNNSLSSIVVNDQRNDIGELKKSFGITILTFSCPSITWMIAPIINVIVVIGINTAYVILYLSQSNNVIIVLQVLLAIFNSFWNTVGYGALSNCVNYCFQVNIQSVNYSSLELLIILTNNILIPCIVQLFIDPECFYNLFSAAPAVEATFQIKACLLIDEKTNICSAYTYDQQNTSFDPPFIYNYQCSSSFVTCYAPSFVYLCIIDGFVFPLYQIISIQIYKYGKQKKTNWSGYAGKMLPFMLPIMKIDLIDESETIERDKLDPISGSLQLFLSNFNYFGLMMTFGATFPPLAASLFVTIYITSYQSLFYLGKFLSYAKERGRIDYVQIINQECKECFSNEVITRGIWMTIMISFIFYSLFFFDTLGESVGVFQSFWVLIVAPLIPILYYFIYRYISIWNEKKNINSKENTSSDFQNNMKNINNEITNPILLNDIYFDNFNSYDMKNNEELHEDSGRTDIIVDYRI